MLITPEQKVPQRSDTTRNDHKSKGYPSKTSAAAFTIYMQKLAKGNLRRHWNRLSKNLIFQLYLGPSSSWKYFVCKFFINWNLSSCYTLCLLSLNSSAGLLMQPGLQNQKIPTALISLSSSDRRSVSIHPVDVLLVSLLHICHHKSWVIVIWHKHSTNMSRQILSDKY